ncbi:hypothetical protein C3B44_05525 [Corynebacterium yudongzhengii]|uniref:NlpC/P60 family protein n=1 Tax=Corynebacterium yudongzhengii TaxID=2080740 RepID=A0A2U1T8G3_9CORY|nr:hypothetical protein C3B44_05525 [Corynebacterium yudongzhengii]PWC02272.1 NlpC/P60 family protein [Corynebacterium yudongzhengii]
MRRVVVSATGASALALAATTTPAYAISEQALSNSHIATPSSQSSAGDRTQDIEAVINRALSQIGTPYAWGGGNANGPTQGIRDGGIGDTYGDYDQVGFDCSGLMVYAFNAVGLDLPSFSGYQYLRGEKVSHDELQRGDLLFWGPNGSQHVALYLGDGQMIEAPTSGGSVRVTDVRWEGLSDYAVRMV